MSLTAQKLTSSKFARRVLNSSFAAAVTTNPAGTSNPVSVSLDVTETAPRLRLSSESISISRSEGSAAETAVLEVRNERNELVGRGESTLHVIPTAASQAKSVSVLLIGFSMTN